MKILIAAIAACLVGIAGYWLLAGPQPKQRVVIVSEAVACKNLDTLKRALQLYADGDKQAVLRLLISSSASDECTAIPMGTHAFVTDRTWDSRFGCLRPAGTVDCRWTGSNFWLDDTPH